MEAFIVEHIGTIIQLIVYIVLGAIGFDRLRTGQKDQKESLKELSERAEMHWEKLDNKIISLDMKLADHIQAVNPHQSCVGHQTYLTEIEQRLGRVQNGIVRLESWMMHFATGRPIPAPGDE